jgi:hypothetical protein
MERAKGHFQEIRRQLPKERQRTAERAKKTANKAKNSADSFRKASEQANKTAGEANTAVKDAKQTLKQVRSDGRQTLRDARQKAGIDRSQPKGSGSAHASASGIKPNLSDSAVSRPNYLSKGVNAPKGAGNAAKSAERAGKGIKSTARGTVKTAKKSVKTAEQSAKAAVKTAQHTAKTAQKTAQASVKTAKAAEKAARAAAKAAVQTAKATVRAITALVKASIAAIKGLVAAIAAGGWVAVVIILIISMIGMLVGSVFGIFFSKEPTPGTGQTVNSVITEINSEYTVRINSIISTNAHDLLDMSGARAAWKQVLAVYTVRTVSDPDNPMEVATMTAEKAAILRSVFWDMNTISYALDSYDVVEDVLDDDGLPTGETTTVTTTVLRINVSHKTTDEMAVQYGFTIEQTEWLQELLKPDYHNLWNALLYGITSIGDGSMIEIADSQIGNIGGETYWSWYGFSEHVAWCACFVSWCAKQCGYIDTGIIPLFSWCPTGAQWFIDRGQWQDNTYTPSPGDIIFFDWQQDGEADHVGIVESVVNGMVNTIEGNTSDSVARRSYELGSIKIYGFGIPKY